MQVETSYFTVDEPFRLVSGETLESVTIAYETYGELSPEKDNAILLFHALSGSQHAAGYNPKVKDVEDLWNEECQTGWWDGFVGSGKAIDTDRYYVICANYLGSCYGSTGPRSINPETGRCYAGAFPVIQFNDIVDSQLPLLDHLGIEKLHAVIGGSLGGYLCINFSARYPKKVKKVIPLAAGLQVTILQRIHNFEQIFAIEEDLKYQSGFYDPSDPPIKGLALARMISQKTFISLETIARRSRREIIQPDEDFKVYKLTNPVESYMLHQGKKFVKRFDANSYVRIVNAWQMMDLAADAGAEDLVESLSHCREQEYLLFSIDSDVCFYPEEQSLIATELEKTNIPYEHLTVHSEKGHDSFLIEPDLYAHKIRSFLSR